MNQGNNSTTVEHQKRQRERERERELVEIIRDKRISFIISFVLVIMLPNLDLIKLIRASGLSLAGGAACWCTRSTLTFCKAISLVKQLHAEFSLVRSRNS